MRRTFLFLTVLCFCLTVAWAGTPSKAGDRESTELTVPRMAFALLSDEKSGSIRLITSDFQQHEIAIEPTDVTVVSLHTTPVLASVSIPQDKHRTHLLISGGAGHEWAQIPSSAPYRMTGALQFFLTSPALPSPGQMRIGLLLADNQIDGQPSTVDISRPRDPVQTFGLEEKVMAFLVKGNFPTLTDEQALQTARALLQSDVLIEMKLSVRLRSVEAFGVGNAFIQVWGD